jgi:hypothetical protein
MRVALLAPIAWRTPTAAEPSTVEIAAVSSADLPLGDHHQLIALR